MRVLVTLSPAEHAVIAKQATQMHRSLSGQIKYLLTRARAFDQTETQPKPKKQIPLKKYKRSMNANKINDFLYNYIKTGFAVEHAACDICGAGGDYVSPDNYLYFDHDKETAYVYCQEHFDEAKTLEPLEEIPDEDISVEP